MKLKEALHFDENKYRKKIPKQYASNEALAKEIYRKRAKKLSAKVRTGVGVLAATATGGASLVGSAFSARNISVEQQKLKLLEEEWDRRGLEKLSKSKFKDKIVPVAIAASAGIFAAGMDVVLSGASPDQFYQIVPDPVTNAQIISGYYTVVEQGLSSAGNFVTGKVVTVGRGGNYESSSSGNGDSDDDNEKYGHEDSDQYESDGKDYSDDDNDNDSDSDNSDSDDYTDKRR